MGAPRTRTVQRGSSHPTVPGRGMTHGNLGHQPSGNFATSPPDPKWKVALDAALRKNGTWSKFSHSEIQKGGTWIGTVQFEGHFRAEFGAASSHWQTKEKTLFRSSPQPTAQEAYRHAA